MEKAGDKTGHAYQRMKTGAIFSEQTQGGSEEGRRRDIDWALYVQVERA